MAIHLLRNYSTTLPLNMYSGIIWFTAIGTFLVPVMVQSSVSPEQLGPKDCRLENVTRGVNAYCLHLKLTTIPDYLPLNTITLDASFNQIKALGNDSFTSLRHLTALNVAHNLISKLDVGTFAPLTNLRTLSMLGNKLTHLHREIFDCNPLLANLILSSNNLSFVPTDAVASLQQLKKIMLNDNSIMEADFSALSHSCISTICMNSNKLSSLKSSDFKPLQNASIQTLDLTYNILDSLPDGLFTYLQRVDNLNLKGNKLTKFRLSTFLSKVKINVLMVMECKIQYIIPVDNCSHQNITFPTIDSVDISSNIIVSIPPYAFLGLNQTEIFKMAGNMIGNLHIKSFCGLDSLTYLDLSRNSIRILHACMFSCNSHLQQLLITNNQLFTLNPMTFQGLSALQKLDLSNNQLQHTKIDTEWNNTALLWLDISYNKFDNIDRYLLRGNLTNLQILNASHNSMNTPLSPHAFIHVPSLREIFLNSIEVQWPNKALKEMKSLIKLDLSYAKTHIKYIDQFTETISLEQLRMCQNNLKSKDLFHNETKSSLFDGLVSLKQLNLQGNSLNNLEPGVFRSKNKLHSLDLSKASILILNHGLFEGLHSLRTLYINENDITITTSTTFSGLVHLGSLYFRKNRLQVLDKNLLVSTPNLYNLYISGNQLTKVQSNTFFPQNHTFVIDVSGNPLACNCELSWFVNWLHESNTNVKHSNETKCHRTSLKAVVDLPLLNFDPANFCGVNTLLITALSLSGIVTGFVCIMTYRKRWLLKHKLFLLKLAIIGYQEMAEDFDADNYEFHLNLMFHEAEEEWVNEVMKPALEERMPHLRKTLYGDKDLHLGMFYLNAIYDAIESSFKTVLLISNQSITDAWFMTKLRMALEHLNDTGLDKVMLVFLEDIDDNHMPYLVRLFMSRNKPSLWTDDEDGQELFWAKFQKDMRANKAINNIIPV